MSIEGIGENAAAFLKTISSLINLISQEKQDAIKFYSLQSVKDYLVNFFSNYNNEVFYAFLLSKTEKIISKIQFTSGKIDEINFLASEFNKAFANNKPYAVVIAHNHPSGNPEPSKKDDATTEKLYLSFALSGVKLYDHIIVGGNKVYSYKTDGRLNEIMYSINERFGF